MKIIINGITITNITGSSTANTYAVAQANVFSNYQPVYYSGAIWALARANALNTMGTHIILNVTANGFDAVQSGVVSAPSHGIGNPGDWLYVSEGVAGTLTSIPPTIYSNPLVFVYSADILFVFPYQASKITPALLFSQLTDGFAYTVADSLKVVRVKLDGSGLEPANNNATIPDPMPILIRSTNPTDPDTGFLNFFPKVTGCKPTLYYQDEDSNVLELQESLFEKDFLIISPLSSTSINKYGGDAGSLGVISHPTIVGTDKYWSQTTLATANDGAGVSSTTATFFGSKGFSYYVKHYFPDADYGSGATGVRIALGVGAAILTTIANADDPANERACFHFSTNLSETNWMFSTRDSGGTEHRVSTGIAFVAQHQYKFWIDTYNGTTYKYRIDDVTAGTTSGVLEATLNLPTVSTALFAGFGLRTLTTTARVINTHRSATISKR